MRRLHPTKISQNVNALVHLVPELEEEILQRVDQPLEMQKDDASGKLFIKSEYNRDGDSHRSPWSNKYFPALEDALFPSEQMREFEIKANFLFEEYRRLYYEGGISSTYVWEKDDGGFALAFLMKKDVEKLKGVERGIWDSINVVDVKIDKVQKTVSYKITTSIILEMLIKTPEAGEVTIAGTLSKKKEETCALVNNDEFHLGKIGKLIEDIETTMRMTLDSVYLGKTREIVFTTRLVDGSKAIEKKQSEIRKELFGSNN